MYYYGIPIIVLFLVAICSDSSTWSPFQSDQVREICAHMTKAERRAAVKRGAVWGAVIGIIPGVIALILGAVVFRSAVFGVTVCFLIFPLVALVLYKTWLPNLIKSQQSFLASTEWARSEGINADDIQLYKWKK